MAREIVARRQPNVRPFHFGIKFDIFFFPSLSRFKFHNYRLYYDNLRSEKNIIKTWSKTLGIALMILYNENGRKLHRK